MVPRERVRPSGWQERRWRSAATAAVAGVILASLVLGALHLTPGHAWGDDFAGYVLQARALWAGDTAAFIEHSAYTILRSSHRVGPVAYPWGYPVLLVPSWALAGLDPLALKIPGLLLFGAFLVVLHLLAREFLGRTGSVVVLLAFAFHPQLLSFLDHVLSDVPYLFLSTLTLLLAVRAESRPRGSMAWGTLVGAAAFGAFFTRPVGFLLLASFAAVRGWRAVRARTSPRAARDEAGPAVVAAVVFTLLWAVTRAALPGGLGSYLSWLGGTSLATTWANARMAAADATWFFTGSPAVPWTVALILAVAGVGAVVAGLRGAVPVVHTGLYLAMLLAWPDYQGLRFLLPVLPPVAILTMVGLEVLSARAWPSRPRLLLVSTGCAWVVLAGLRLATVGKPLAEEVAGGGPFGPASQELFRFVRESTSPDETVVFFKPRAMRLMTGRDSLLVTRCTHLPESALVVLRRIAAGPDEMTPETLSACGVTPAVVFENRAFVAYRTGSPASTMESRSRPTGTWRTDAPGTEGSGKTR